jgi:protein-S-isoprenylcysteine O-methyltransferase Ste14
MLNIQAYRTVATGLAPVVLLLAVWQAKSAAASLAAIIAGTVLVLAGSGLRLWAAGHMGAKGEDLAATGPYAHTRNPLYMGTIIAGLGFCLASGLWWSYILIFSLFTLFYIPTIISEERLMAERHGETYRDYARHVPRFSWRIASHVRSGAFSFGRAVMHKEHLVAPQLLILLALFWLRLFISGAPLGRA